jgi:hypothetical protein
MLMYHHVQGDGAKDGIIALEPNDDFAMGAHPVPREL